MGLPGRAVMVRPGLEPERTASKVVERDPPRLGREPPGSRPRRSPREHDHRGHESTERPEDVPDRDHDEPEQVPDQPSHPPDRPVDQPSRPPDHPEDQADRTEDQPEHQVERDREQGPDTSVSPGDPAAPGPEAILHLIG